MIQKYVALICVLLVLGTPMFAGEFVNMRLIPNRLLLPSVASATSGSSLAFGLPYHAQDPQNQAPPQPPAQRPPDHRELTTKGKVLKWVGIGLIGTGGLTMALGAAETSSNCGGYSGQICSDARTIDFAAGGVQAGIGVLLLFLGLHSRE